MRAPETPDLASPLPSAHRKEGRGGAEAPHTYGSARIHCRANNGLAGMSQKLVSHEVQARISLSVYDARELLHAAAHLGQ